MMRTTAVVGSVLGSVLTLTANGALGANLELQPGDDLPTLMTGLAAGDEAVLASGVYELESTIQLSDILATEGAPTVIRAAEGATPILELHGSGWIINLSRSTHVRVEGLTLRGGGDFVGEERSINGVLMTEGTTNITLIGNTITDITGDGIRSPDGVGLVIRHNEVSHTSGGIAMSFGSNDASVWLQDSVIQNNYIHHVPREAIWHGPGCFGNRIVDNTVHAVEGNAAIVVQSTEFGAANVVEGNAVWDVRGHGLAIGGTALVRNNVVFGVDGTGIRAIPSNAAAYDDVVISFNTVVDTVNDGIDIRYWAGHTGMVLANNVVSNPTGYAMEAEAKDYDADNLITDNVVSGLVRGFEELAGHFRAGYGEGDFVDAPAWNYYPSTTSSLRDSANPSGATFVPEFDFNGLPRPGDSPDVGALEYSGTTNPGWLIREGFKAPPVVDSGEVEVEGCENCAGESEGTAAAMFPLLLAGLGLSRRRDGRRRRRR
jgi:hypothetical protein